MPLNVYAKYGQEFSKTIKSRRDNLRDGVMKYYRFLSEEIIINGSNADESFSVRSTGDLLRISVYRMDGSKQKIYERNFSPSETYFITLNGLAGNDVFEIDEKTSSKIRLIINGGEGVDRYSIKGKIHTKINDTAAEKNAFDYQGQANIHLN